MYDKGRPMPLVLVPSTFSPDERGKFFEGVVANLLKKQRYDVTERVRFTGMEIDVLADHKDTRQRAYVECKFARDPFSSEVVDKLLGKGFRKRVDIVYLFSVSEPGKEARGVIDELTRSTRNERPRFAFVGPDGIVDSFQDLYGVECDERILPDGTNAGGVHLAIVPDLPPFWIVEELDSGLPVRSLLVGRDPSVLQRNFARLKNLFADNEVLSGIPMTVHGASPSGPVAVSRPTFMKETVAPVVTADSLDDYRPCRPQDFVGRDGLQREVWTFLERVRQRETDSRIISLSGPSGFGKSSTVVKLADRFRNVRWRTRFFLHSVDSRAAEGPLFVPAAVKAAFDSAIDRGFLDIDLEEVRIHSSESILDSPDVVRCLEWLEQNQRVLVLFFDQFEEMLYKQELQPVFEAFRRLAFETGACQGSLVLGFSWRTGITLPDGNAAYHVWHSLSDIRVSLQVGRFLGKESSRLITLFQQALGQSILRPLRRRLIEQGQGIPWLLKKLCIHIYREIARGISQYELLERRLNIASLFEEDLQLLSSEVEQVCLHFIAENSPVALNEVAERFGESTLNSLYENRLIVRVGGKYAIYWDVFRDYLKEGQPPPIPWAYVPVVSVSMAMRGFKEIQRSPSIDLDHLSEILGYTSKTTVNIIGDLQNLVLITRTPDGSYLVHPELEGASTVEVADSLHKLFEDHVATRAVRDAFREGQRISLPQFNSAVQDVYLSAGVQSDYAKRYAQKLRPWLRFAGHLDKQQNAMRLPESGIGRDLGVFADRSTGRTGRAGGWLFLGSASAERVVDLAIQLSARGEIVRREILISGSRNAADDLRSLGMAYWEDQTLKGKGTLAAQQIQEWKDGVELIGRAAARTELISTARRILEGTPDIGAIDLGGLLALSLEKAWSTPSKNRYGGAAKRWVRFVAEAGL
jgi:Holliday junction resolvase-like predicted endonuclease